MIEPHREETMNMAAGPPPGGWGPPPGGAPPGGGYGAPPGGFGPPGGYGAPPGGFGPPGGGYGAPPGGFGAPQGFGPGPGGYGPPPAPKSNVGLFIGLGCVGLVLLCGIGAAIVATSVKRYTEKAIDGEGSTSGSVGTGSAEVDTGPLKAELRDLRAFTTSTAGTQYFVGELFNTGDAPIGHPSATITFYDAASTALDTGSCWTLVRELAPGDKVPCTHILSKPIPWKTYKVEIKPSKSYFKGQVAELAITGAESIAKARYDPHLVTGKITNESSFKAKGVWAIASLYGADGKIVGADRSMVAGSDLAPGASGLFKIRLYHLAAEPTTFRVIAVGYSE